MTETTEQLPTVHQAWASVMGEVRGLGKNQRNNSPGGNYSFRGIDDVMNAVGPALRNHGVAVVPSVTQAQHRDVQTSKGKPAREATVLVNFTVYGPRGDSFTGAAPGESMDSGDKGTAKAMSVAMRTFLLQALCLPTDETDPDAQSYERAPQQETPAQAALRGIAQAPTPYALDQVLAWAQQQGVAEQVREAAAARRSELAGPDPSTTGQQTTNGTQPQSN